MIPSQVEMVQKYKDAPFTIIGINTDPDQPRKLKKKFAENKITWPQIAEGDSRKHAGKWNVNMFPTIYVIDHKGVIRGKDLHGQELDDLVAKLVTEAEKDNKSKKAGV